MTVSVELEVFEDGAVFRHGDSYDEVVEQLDDLLDGRDGGDIAPSTYRRELERLVERWPEFIDGHAHLGYVLMETNKPKLALEACLRGFRLGEEVIPSGFTTTIPWGFHENRPFLRAAHGVALCQLRLGRRRDATVIMERMLAWNPNDNQGIRFLIGSQYLRIGETEKAGRVFDTEAASYPPYHYEHALLHLRADNYVSAATSLRRGFVGNGYVAEMLCGNSVPAPMAIWHGSNLAEPETAVDYLQACNDLWQNTSKAVPFLRWLHGHPKVLIERAGILECQEALLWDFDFQSRGVILDREKELRGGIDDALSRAIVRKYVDRHGRSVEPWALWTEKPRR